MTKAMVGNFTLEDAINTGGMFYLDGDQITHAGNSTDARETDLIIERIEPNVYEYVNGTVDRFDVYNSFNAELNKRIPSPSSIFDPSSKTI